MKKISILGCGWLGFAAAQFFLNLGYKVNGSTTSPEKTPLLEQAGIDPFILKITDKISSPASFLESKNKTQEQILDDFFSSELLLLNIPPGRRNPSLLEDHPKQIQAVINAAMKRGVKKLIFISSTGVYGSNNNIVTEETPPSPERTSGKALVQIEDYLRHQKEPDITILRMAGLVGGDRKAGRFFAGKENVKGGSARVNMVHRQDCIGVIHAVIEQNVWGETFNVCADSHPTKKEFYTQQAITEGFIPPTFSEEDNQADFKIVSNIKVKKYLDYSFQHDF